jgi:hypothetical protein
MLYPCDINHSPSVRRLAVDLHISTRWYVGPTGTVCGTGYVSRKYAEWKGCPSYAWIHLVAGQNRNAMRLISTQLLHWRLMTRLRSTDTFKTTHNDPTKFETWRTNKIKQNSFSLRITCLELPWQIMLTQQLTWSRFISGQQSDTLCSNESTLCASEKM